MGFIASVPEEEATGDIAALYEADRQSLGYVANYTRTFSSRPEVMRAWQQLNGAIKAGMDLRRYELATVAAARRLRSSYCALAHGKILADRFVDPQQVAELARDHRFAGLDPVDTAIMDLADKVATDAASVTAADIDGLRRLGLTDADILDVILAAAARCFFSSVLEAAGAEPDAAFLGLDPALREALTVGRPIAGADPRPTPAS
jgi:uncharacterized peroxidase-related enzyme